MKNGSRIVVDVAFHDTLSVNDRERRKFGSSSRFALIAASALICWASFGFSQTAKAGATLTVADIQSALQGSQQASQVQPASGDDAALSALSAFAQQIGTDVPKPAVAQNAVNSTKFDDQAFSCLLYTSDAADE